MLSMYEIKIGYRQKRFFLPSLQKRSITKGSCLWLFLAKKLLYKHRFGIGAVASLLELIKRIFSGAVTSFSGSGKDFGAEYSLLKQYKLFLFHI